MKSGDCFGITADERTLVRLNDRGEVRVECQIPGSVQRQWLIEMISGAGSKSVFKQNIGLASVEIWAALT